MDEREHHDDFYLRDAATVFDSALFAEVRRRMEAFLTAHGCRSECDRVLSLGCGDGRVECLMAARVGAIIGIEISPVAVEQARARAARLGRTNLHFEVGDIQALAVEPASFDAVWALGVLHHLDAGATAALLRRAWAALRPGGVFVANDPSARRLVGLFKRWFAAAYDRYHSPDEHEVEAQELAQQFAAAGFAPVAVRYNDFFLGPLAWLFPRCPPALVPAVAAMESVLLAVPGLRRKASSFCIVARKPAV